MVMEQRRTTPPRNSLSAGVSAAAQNPAKANTVIPAREIIILRRVLNKTPSSKIQHKRMEKPALMRERQTERSRNNLMPPSEDEASLDDDEFVVPEDPDEQERFQRRLMAPARSHKKNSNSSDLIKIC